MQGTIDKLKTLNRYTNVNIKGKEMLYFHILAISSNACNLKYVFRAPSHLYKFENSANFLSSIKNQTLSHTLYVFTI